MAKWWKGPSKRDYHPTSQLHLVIRGPLLCGSPDTGRGRACSGVANDARIPDRRDERPLHPEQGRCRRQSMTTTKNATLLLDCAALVTRRPVTERGGAPTLTAAS